MERRKKIDRRKKEDGWSEEKIDRKMIDGKKKEDRWKGKRWMEE